MTNWNIFGSLHQIVMGLPLSCKKTLLFMICLTKSLLHFQSCGWRSSIQELVLMSRFCEKWNLFIEPWEYVLSASWLLYFAYHSSYTFLIELSPSKGGVDKIGILKEGISLTNTNWSYLKLPSSQCVMCMFSWFMSFLSILFVFHRKGLVLLNLIYDFYSNF